MSNEMPAARNADAHFSFTKLLVDDLEATHAFYTSVCGLVEQFRYESDIDGRAISEICYAPTSPGGGALALLKFLNGPASGADEVILGFTTENLEAFIARAEAAGGSIAEAPRDMTDLNMRVAFVKDCEGHLIEVVEMA